MEFEQLSEKLRKQIINIKGDVALYVKFLKTDEIFKHNETKPFWAASLIKVPITLELFAQVEQKKLSLEQEIKVLPENIVKGSGILHLLEQRKFALKDLITLSLTLSDNSAANQLIEIVAMENINELIKKIGLKTTVIKHKLMIAAGKGPNLTTAMEMAELFELLFKNKLSGSQEILKLLNEEKRRDIFPVLLPNEVFLPHKTGALNDGFHDCGIVYAKNPFIFAFLSDELENKQNAKNLANEIAKEIFDYANI